MMNHEQLLTRKDFSSPYKADFVCFHWGSDNSKGSEHLLDGKSYPMEVKVFIVIIITLFILGKLKP